MRINATLYNVFGYALCAIISMALGYVSTCSNDENDYVQKLSYNIIPLLLTLLVLYSTLTIHFINELRKLDNNENLGTVVYELRRNIVVEVVILVILFILLGLKNYLLASFNDYSNLIQFTTNSLVVFTFLYFIWVIFDVTMGLYELVMKNINV